jgi:hypothetical protein
MTDAKELSGLIIINDWSNLPAGVVAGLDETRGVFELKNTTAQDINLDLRPVGYGLVCLRSGEKFCAWSVD